MLVGNSWSGVTNRQLTQWDYEVLVPRKFAYCRSTSVSYFRYSVEQAEEKKCCYSPRVCLATTFHLHLNYSQWDSPYQYSDRHLTLWANLIDSSCWDLTPAGEDNNAMGMASWQCLRNSPFFHNVTNQILDKTLVATAQIYETHGPCNF